MGHLMQQENISGFKLAELTGHIVGRLHSFFEMVEISSKRERRPSPL